MLENLADNLEFVINSISANLYFLGAILGVLWGIQFINAAVGYRLNIFGIWPRRIPGLLGIFTSPFLHGSVSHLLFNSIPLFFLSALILVNGQAVFLQVSFFIIWVSGALTWLLGRPAIHVGASGVIMGYWGFLLFGAYEQPSIVSFLTAGLCLYYCGGLVFSLFPQEEKVSWEGHIFGFLAGLLASYLLLHTNYFGNLQ